jgi:CHASE2 domain-containing sensor protein
MFFVLVAVAQAQTGVVSALRASAPEVKRWGGWLLLAVGSWLLVLGVFAGFFADRFPV